MYISAVSNEHVFMSVGKAESQLSTVMDRLRARSLHQASWMETVKVLSTSLSAVSLAAVVLLALFCLTNFYSVCPD